MYEKEFALRLAQLRNNTGVSARDMSLSIGQNHGYINVIESGKALPSMSGFFYICEFLNVTPKEFFDFETENPKISAELMNEIQKLDYNETVHLLNLVKDLNKKK